MIQHLRIPRDGLTLAADLHVPDNLPDGLDPARPRPAVGLSTPGSSVKEERVLTHRARQRTLDNLGQHADRSGSFPERGLIRRRAGRISGSGGNGDNELAALEQRVAAASGKGESGAGGRLTLVPL